jgi:hypothetical protein
MRYEKARVPLSAAVSAPTSVLEAPDVSSSVLVPLHANDRVTIIGRSGGWFQVEATGRSGKVIGWLSSGSVRVLGAAPSAPAPLSPPPSTKVEIPALPTPASPKPVRRVEQRQRDVPLRLIPHLGFAYGAKNIPHQIRVGTDVMWGLFDKSEAGFSLEAGFRKATLIAVGPAFLHHLRWPSLGRIRTDLFGGLSAFIIHSSAGNDFRYGPRMGADGVFTIPGTELEGLVRVSVDVLLFGEGSVSIPVGGMVGAAFHF